MSDQRKEYRIEGRDSTIFRVQKNPDNPYVMVDRRPIDNPNLSYRAKGVLTYLLSRPDGWEVNIGDLVKHGVEGRDALRATLKELREAGHLEYQQERQAGKFSTGKILVYEVPLAEPQTDFQEADLPEMDKPRAENPTQVLNKLSSNKENNKTTTSAKSEAFTLYEKNIGPLTPMIADSIKDAELTYSPEWVARAIQEAAKSNVRRWNYIEGVLRGYRERGSPDIGRDFAKSQQAATKNSRTANKTTPTESKEEILRRIAQNVKLS